MRARIDELEQDNALLREEVMNQEDEIALYVCSLCLSLFSYCKAERIEQLTIPTAPDAHIKTHESTRESGNSDILFEGRILSGVETQTDFSCESETDGTEVRSLQINM